MQGFVRACRAGDVTGSTFVRVTVGDAGLLLARLPDGTFAAFGTACPHQGHPLRRGQLTPEGAIECPHHFYAYDPVSGRNVFPGDEDDLVLDVYDAVEHDGWIWIRRTAKVEPGKG